MRRHRTALLAAWLCATVVAAPVAAAGLSAGGVPVANTSTASPTAQLAGPPTVVRRLAAPGSPGDDDPAALAALGSPNGPDDDLGDALDALSAATDAAGAAAARQFALDILEGNPIPGRVYSGIPLLDWDVPARVKTVPAGGAVTVTEVRFAGRAISDTALLQFADPAQPFTINYRIAELGTAFGGVFSPSPMLSSGATPAGGLASVVVPLAVGNQSTGTTDTNRFHPGGAAEATRATVQEFAVKMPPPGLLTAIVNPDVRPGHSEVATLTPATPDRLAALSATYGFSGATPTAAEKAAAIAKLAPGAPAKVLWSALAQLGPADPGFLAAAHAAGTQNRALVTVLSTHSSLPAGLAVDPGPPVAVAVAGGEAYSSHPSIAATGSVAVALTNADGFARDIAVRVLHDRKPVHGGLDWGEFAWSTGATATLAPGEQRTVNITLGHGAFALWVGDPNGGDQASTVVAIDNTPRKSVLAFSSNVAAPGHIAQDSTGHLWVALAGIDTIARITPVSDVRSSRVEEFRLPGGNFDPASTAFPLAPHDVWIDARGIVWSTLAAGNAIARLDPALARAGTSDGIRLYPLPACTVPLPACAPPIPPVAGHPPISRDPNQMKGFTAANGDTVLWFTETNADAIGAMRITPDGTLVQQADLACGCGEPLGLALGTDGAVWFSEVAGNQVVRITPSPVAPFDATAATFDRFPVPSSVEVIDAAHPAPGIHTAGAHSLAIDTLGRVWVTEEETGKVGMLDPAVVRPGSAAGFVEFPLGLTDFGTEVAPADLTIDGTGTVFFVDEYGDAVGSVTPAGMVTKWRPLERASQTDSPFVDSAGNLWFSETGANLLTRLSVSAAGTAMPSPPPTVTADVAAGTVSGAGLTGVAAVDIDVTRGTAVTAHTPNVPVTNGMFSVATPGLAGDDTVRITPHARPAQAPITFTVASVSVTANAAGRLSGLVSAAGSPLGESVTITPGGAGAPAAVSVALARGAFSASLPPGTSGSVVWAGATVAGIFRTVTAFAVPGPPPTPVQVPGLPAGDQPPLPGTGTGADAVPAPAPLSALALACRDRLWLAQQTVPLLGLSPAGLQACLGAPTRVRARRSSQTWTYRHALDVQIRNNTVTRITVRDASFTSDAGKVGVGSPLWQVSLALPKVRYDRATRRFRAVAALEGGGFADIRFPASRSRKPRVASFTITRVQHLDSFGRRLL